MNLSSTSEQFYPTPDTLITKMLEGLKVRDFNYILEPSAGKGDIADAVVRKIYGTDYWHESQIRDRIDCVEINPNLQHILIGKGYRVVHDDFLSYRTKKQYDLIAMNPPFNNGDMHLLHALDLVREGGTVICILNAETLRNTYTKSRQLLMQKLNEYGASIEYLQNEFIDAERKTDVEIALVKVTTPVVEHVSFIFEGLKGKEYPEVDYECKALVGGDFIAQIVKQYEMEVEMGIKLIDEYKAMEPLILNSFDKSNNYKSPMLSLKVYNDDATVNEYIKAVRNKYWHALFQNEKFTGKLTSNLQDELDDKVKELEDYDFSVYNIEKVYQEIMQKLNMGVEETIMKLFDKLSGEHSWYPETQKNIHYYNGWATNKAHKINKKVIIPICGAFSSYNYSWDRDTFKTYEVFKVMSDIEKTLTYLSTGDTCTNADLIERLEIANRNGQTRKIPLKFFNITLYKKGTCHIEFTDLELLDRLNIYGSRHKGWLPPSYGKKQYRDMTDEEKTVIDEFQGADEYSRVMANPNKYIVETNNLLRLAA